MLDDTRSAAVPAATSGSRNRDGLATMQPAAPFAPRRRHGLDLRDPACFATRLEGFRRHHAGLYDARGKGGLFILDLAELRRRCAARWPLMQDRALQFIEGLFARRLGANDLYLTSEVERFWLLLTDIDRAAAERLARRLAAEITERLCGVIPGGVACRLITTRFDLTTGLLGVRDAATLERRLAASMADPPDAATAAVAGSTPRFTPVLSPKKRQISIHLLEASPVGDALAAAADGETAAARDCWAVAEVAGLLADRGFRAAASIRLHYATLATMRYRQKLMLACRRLPGTARRRLLIEIIDLPETLPQARVRELVSYLRPFTLGVFVAVEPSALGRQTRSALGHRAEATAWPGHGGAALDHLANTGIAGLALDLAGDQAGDPAGQGRAAHVPGLIARARRLGVRTFCHVGAGRRSLRAAMVAGIDHLAGEALAQSSRHPIPTISITRKGASPGNRG